MKKQHKKTSTKACSNLISNTQSLISNDHRGITLVALIITIIVMLILVGVSITIAIKGGLFDTTKSAAKGTKAEIEAEQELSNGRVKIDGTWYDSIEDYVGGKESNDQTDPEKPVDPIKPSEPETPPEEPPEIPAVGDIVNYQPDTVSTKYKLLGTQSGYGDYSSSTTPYTLQTPKDQEIGQDTLTWQVLKVHDGTIDLIGTPTDTAVYFGGWLGYNNGVYLMHDICETLYSRKSNGITARSVSLGDFEDSSNGGAWKTARNSYTGGAGYGNTKEYTDSKYRYYPNLYAQENGSGINTSTVKTDGIKDTNKYYTSPTTETWSQASSKLTVTQTYYNIVINEANYKDTASILSNSTEYWVASRCAGCDSPYAYFGLRYAYSNLDYYGVFYSSGNAISRSCRLRPVVSLESSVQYEKVSETDGVKTFNITKY